ncbi:hypothetical protein GGR57DRAFT_447548 [Xylariaceae sp. FL1272]|nr:hypothetical protein GGR57DRAFT_447548 [Xylariaceae sp. FL1272]
MHFTKPFKSSPHSLSSPDGKYVATILQPSNLVVRSIESLTIIRTIKLPPDLSGGVTHFFWSPSSTSVLIAAAEQVHVFSAIHGNFHGSLQIPQPLAAKPACVGFGGRDDEIFVWSPFGIKLTVANLTSSRAVEINNPKFYNTISAPRGSSLRHNTHHLALLIRVSGKDIISIHAAETREAQRSWSPDTSDAQGIAWTPDGKWLVVWESSAHGNRVLFYTPDGHMFKDWRGGHPQPAIDDMDRFGTGVKTIGFTQNGRYTAVANGSDAICVLNDRLAESMRLHHNYPLQPKETLKIWQEHMNLHTGQPVEPTFAQATHAITPPLTPATGPEPRPGCNLVRFDSSSCLLASRLDDAPSTIWIWDVPSCELRAVLMYHSNVIKAEWHPLIPELLLIRCEGEEYSGLAFVWDPLSDGPCSINFLRHLPNGKINGKAEVSWLKTANEAAALFFTDHATGVLVAIADGNAIAWGEPSALLTHENIESPTGENSSKDHPDDSSSSDMDDGHMDDTFHFKKSPMS